MNKTAKAQRCFSLAFYVTTNGNKKKGSTTQAQLAISTSEGNEIMVKAQLDTGGSQNLASRELLQNINTTDHYQRLPMKMITVNGDTPPYNNMGELHFNDSKGNPVVLLCYVQEQPIHGYNHFALISSDSLVDISADINHHAKMSKAGEILPLQRENETAYHYSDVLTDTNFSTVNLIENEDKEDKSQDQIPLNTLEDNTKSCESAQRCSCKPRILREIEYVRLRSKKPKRSHGNHDNPKKDKPRTQTRYGACFMSEIQLQNLLDRTKGSEEDEGAMDMTLIDGVRMSKFDIRAVKVGKRVSTDMKLSLNEFNKKYVGAHSVFPEKNGAPRILEQFKDKPYTLELHDQYTQGNKPKGLPTIRAAHYQGKPATCKVLEHFVRTTPVVEKCDDPRCFSRLVIVPKRDPGTPKDSPPTSYRVTMDALINDCLKPVASTLPLATDEIKKLHGYKYFIKLDAMHAFWAIPLDEESKKLLAFQTHEGVFMWSRLTMGCRPSSQVQQTAFNNAMDEHMPTKFRHRIALYADDMAAGANTLEELFEIYQALVIALDKAGIQVKASKVEFGVEQVTFHNYRVVGGDGPMANTTTPKDENLDPIKGCGIPQTITQLKALLGATQQMAQYVPYYALVAAPLHRLTKKDTTFPSGNKWIKGSDYDMAYHHIKSLILDKPLYIWNKDDNKHLFIEVDSSDDGWGACAYQYAEDPPIDAEAGKLLMLSKSPKRIIAWISKAWTPYEKGSLPIFYKETIARLLTLEHFRNLIETQQLGHGITCYSDHLPGIKSSSLSNKGKLSTWRIHETSDLTSIVETLYKSGPTMTIADPLSRLARQEQRVDNFDLPVLLQMLLKELPSSIKKANNIRVNAERDTPVVTRMVQRWREPTNPISNTIGSLTDKIDFLITATYADKLTIKIAELIRKDIPFAALIPLPLLNEIERTGKTEIDKDVQSKRLNMKLVISTSLGQAWLINHPECKLNNSCHAVFFTTCKTNTALQQEGEQMFQEWAHELATGGTNPTRINTCSQQTQDIDQLAIDTIDNLMKDGAARHGKQPVFNNTQLTPRETRALKRSNSAPTNKSKHKKQKLSNARTKSDTHSNTQCVRTLTHPMHVISTTASPAPISTWPDKQSMEDVPKDMVIIPENHKKKEWPPKLIVLKDEKNRERILVPACQRVALTKTEHETMLHQDGRRVHYELSRKYYWPKMAEEIKSICKACAKCQSGKIRKQHLSAEFEQAQKEDIPLPRQAYGIDFYGHAHGEILVAIDLCTREVSLWFLQDRKQDKVAKSLLSGLIFQKGVPLVFRNDEAPEFVQGVVHSMNQYLGIKQITTGGHNPRSNAVVERFMQHLTACLTKCDDSQYKNIKDYLPAIAFAHNTAFNSAINCSPFEAGHGLRARTITEARASPRLQIITDRGKILQEPDSKWESSIFLKICKLAERLAEEAQSQSQWHKRMNAYNLNQSGRQISEEPFQTGTRVYFYRPPSQQEVLKTGRKVKHLMHYRGPATVTKLIPGRRRQYEIEFQGKTYKRDVGMLVPEQTISDIDVTTLDPTKSQQETTKPQLYAKGETLHEDKLIICRTDKTDTEWCLAEVSKIYTDEIELTYYTTPAPQAHNYANATKEQRQDNLKNTRFRKTWYLSSGKNIGKATVKAPFPKNPELRLWTGKIPVPEVNDLVLATNIILNPQGYMDNASIDVVSQLPLGHMTTLTIEDEESLKDQLLLTHALFTYTETTLCNCASCAKCFKETHK
jgi:hypothetical protein